MTVNIFAAIMMYTPGDNWIDNSQESEHYSKLL